MDTFSVIHLPVSGTKNLFLTKFGLNLLKVFMLECETLWPTIARFPVISQSFDMAF